MLPAHIQAARFVGPMPFSAGEVISHADWKHDELKATKEFQCHIVARALPGINCKWLNARAVHINPPARHVNAS